METVFVTGATGFIGTYLLREMIKCGEFAQICALYRSEIPFKDEKICWIRGDMEHLPNFSASDGITKVIHCAALMDGVVSPKVLYQTNVKWTEQILSLCRSSGAKELILFSSVNVHLKHDGAYAKSKKRMEELAKQSAIPVKIIRPALVFGNGKNGITKLIKYIRRFPVIPVFGNGRAKEQPIYVEDLAKLSVKYILDKKAGPVIDLYGSEAMEYNHMLQKIAAAQKKRIWILHLPFGLFYSLVFLLERINLKLPVSAEQLAHIHEDLTGAMEPIYKRYDVSPKDFAGYLRMLS
ncbi:MAG: NAD-dependent epimerase/dehydratase family protein [Lachnospiraceae bacterium]|nr:NAD-dependent epimerase/dehydratase family protein [Lachnospiraceae bacterium]